MWYFALLAVLTPLVRLTSAQVEPELRVGTVLVRLPPDAQVVAFPHEQSRLGGTRVRLEERLTVELAAVPGPPVPLKAFVDSIVATRNAHLPTAWHLHPPEARMVGGRTAWVLRPRCGDCEAVEAYLDFPGTRLVVAWGVDGLEALTVRQRHALAWRFVATLRPAPAAG